ncbi:hypothetical protein EV363DRAFT_1458287 [Boletus edulis]|nr:hypothetical protein EV363DRAFT_1458287 [Boletus edulis]
MAVNMKDGPGLVCFFVIYSKRDPLSTPLTYRRFPEGKLALKVKGFLFNHEDDKELSEKVQFTTVADPYGDYYQFRPLPAELKRRYAASSEVNQDAEKLDS